MNAVFGHDACRSLRAEAIEGFEGLLDHLPRVEVYAHDEDLESIRICLGQAKESGTHHIDELGSLPPGFSFCGCSQRCA